MAFAFQSRLYLARPHSFSLSYLDHLGCCFSAGSLDGSGERDPGEWIE